jgi:DnaJ-class molecular chaperone
MTDLKTRLAALGVEMPERIPFKTAEYIAALESLVSELAGRVERLTLCETCAGRGWYAVQGSTWEFADQHQEQCQDCDGTGRNGAQ